VLRHRQLRSNSRLCPRAGSRSGLPSLVGLAPMHDSSPLCGCYEAWEDVSRVGVGFALGVELHCLLIRLDRSCGFRLCLLCLGRSFGRLYWESDRLLWFNRRRGTEVSSLISRRRVFLLREKPYGGRYVRCRILPLAGRIDTYTGLARRRNRCRPRPSGRPANAWVSVPDS
jgi:hypothetical protein